jgi:hypothetical protein
MLATAAACLSLAACGEDQGAPTPPETIVQDDALLLHREPAEVRRTAHMLANLGVDRVRITAGWSAIAPEPLGGRKPAFDAADPAAYPAEGWRRLDRALEEVEAADMKPMLDLAFWAPRWAVEQAAGAPDRQRWRPSAKEFGLFSEAVARRYSGDYEDPATGIEPPEVRLWTTWNEPNHPLFLLPQWERRGGDWVPAAPHHYREMHEAAYVAIKRASDDNRVLLGGLTARGVARPGATAKIAPLRFVRELACVDEELRPLDRPECRGFRPLQADGFAHHPYSFETNPGARSPNEDDVAMGDLERLSGLLGRLSERGRIEGRLPVWVTEYGYETHPPDPYRGIPPHEHARYLAQAAAIALDNSDLRGFAQFLLRDVGPDQSAPTGSRRRWRDYQTGLLFPDGRPKPAFAGFKLPFWAQPDGEGVRVVGQVRPARGREEVTIERQVAAGRWRPAATLETDEHGVVRHLVGERGTFRLRWRGESSGAVIVPG